MPGITIDIPSGIGFCLYVTRACLDRTGPIFRRLRSRLPGRCRFCLRARERRIQERLCALGLCRPRRLKIVPPRKACPSRAQSARVGAAISPPSLSECTAFIKADPLRNARQEIERTAAAIPSHPRLLITGAGVISATARQRAHEIASATQTVMILEVRHRADGAIAKLMNAAEKMPQTLQFNLFRPSECDSWSTLSHPTNRLV